MATYYFLDRQGFAFQKPVTEISNTPPVAPSAGDACLVGTAGSGAFSGHNNQVAVYDGSSWTFSETPAEGWLVYDQDTSKFYYYSGSAWVAWDETANLTKTLGATGQFLIDAATTDHTGTDPILEIDVDVGDITGTLIVQQINIDTIVALDSGDEIRALDIVLDGNSGDDAASELYGIYLSGSGTSGGTLYGIGIGNNFYLGIVSAAPIKFANTLDMYGSILYLDQEQDCYITADNGGDLFTIHVSGANELNLSSTALYPEADEGLDLGTSSYQFKDLYLDGIAYLDRVDVATNIYFEALGGDAHIIKPADEDIAAASNLQLIGGTATGSNGDGGSVVIDGGAENGAGTVGDVEIATNRGALVVGSGGSRITKLEYDSDLNELIVTTA